jgi:hypothetical protein
MFENLGDAHIALEPLATIQTPRAHAHPAQVARAESNSHVPLLYPPRATVLVEVCLEAGPGQRRAPCSRGARHASTGPGGR